MVWLIFIWVFVIISTLWALTALYYFTPFHGVLRFLVCAGWVSGAVFWFRKLGVQYWYAPFIIGFLIILILWQFKRPSHERNWVLLQERLPWAEIDENIITMHNIRKAVYKNETEAESVEWETRTYNLSELKTIDFLVVPFGEWEGPAHTFLSFGFANDSYVAVSVEARREIGEKYGIIRGLFREFETMYVFGDELDVIGARTEYSGDKVYLFPIQGDPEQMRRMFLSMTNEATKIHKKPKFYNTFTNSCTSAIAKHLNQFRDRKIGFDMRVVLPGYSDRLAYEMGLIDIGEPYEEHRHMYCINERADLTLSSQDFSRRIREKPVTSDQ